MAFADNWEAGDASSVNASVPFATDIREHAQLKAAAAIERAVSNRNGTYAFGSAATRKCEEVIRALAPRDHLTGGGRSMGRSQLDEHGARSARAGVQSVCAGARGTLTSSLISHHRWAKRVHSWSRNASGLCTRKAANAIGIKAPSHISE